MRHPSERTVPPLVFILALVGALVVAAAVHRRVSNPAPIAGAFTRYDADKLFDPAEGAVLKAQQLYHCFKPDHDPLLVCPAWLEEEVRAMPATPLKKVRDGKGNRVTEAHLWRSAPSALFDSLETARLRFPADKGGNLSPLPAVLPDHLEGVSRCHFVVDHLRAEAAAPLGGRAPRLIAAYAAACGALERVADAAKAGDERAYRAAVLELADDVAAAHELVRR